MNSMDDEKFLWYRLFRTKGFGPKRISYVSKVLQERELRLEDFFEMSWEQFRDIFPKFSRHDFEEVKYNSNNDEIWAEIQTIKQKGVQIVHFWHPSYPVRLYRFLKDSAPPLLFCKGQLSLLNVEGIAIVGSRSASERGLEIAKRFAGELALQGKNIISGYAKGIDTIAQLGALEADGTTTIILSYGILEFSKKRIFSSVQWEGNILAVSQFRPTEKWRARNAMIRNKLICALSQAVIVVEAGEEKDRKGMNSGSFNAGKTALEMGILLFVLSPSALNKSLRGNQGLIERGAIEIFPEDGIEIVMQYLKGKADESNISVPKSTVKAEQLKLL